MDIWLQKEVFSETKLSIFLNQEQKPLPKQPQQPNQTRPTENSSN